MDRIELKKVKTAKDIRLKHINMISDILGALDLDHLLYDVVDSCKEKGVNFKPDTVIK